MTNATNDWDPKELHGARLGSCVVERTLGVGATGAVYLAQQLRPRRQEAIKVLRPRRAASPEEWGAFLARFRDEADAAAGLDHANIVPIFEFGQEGDRAYLVMPYLAEGSLAALLARAGRLPLPDAVAYVEQAAAALDEAHAHGLIHRDVKPSNLLLHPDGRLMLADFGIARPADRPEDRAAGAGDRAGGAWATAGTPEYMAPEQARGGPLTPATDVYALGVVAYAMLAGQTPFGGGEAREILARQLSAPPPPLRSLRPDVPARVEEVIGWALAKDPAKRPASAGEFARALREAARGRALGGILSRGPRPGEAPRGMLRLASSLVGGGEPRPSGPVRALGAPATPAFVRRANGTRPLTDPHPSLGSQGSGPHPAARARVTPPPLPDAGAASPDAYPDTDAPTLYEGGMWRGDGAPPPAVGALGAGGTPFWPDAGRGPVSPSARRVRRNRPVLMAAAVAAVALLGFACALGGLSQTGLFASPSRPSTPIAAGTPEPTSTPLPTATPAAPANWLSATPGTLTLGCKVRRGELVGEQATVTLQNLGTDSLDWHEEDDGGITVSKHRGTLDPHKSVSITVTNAANFFGTVNGQLAFVSDTDGAGDPAIISYTAQGCFLGGAGSR